MTHQELYDLAVKAIYDLFADTTVEKEETMRSLAAIQEDIETLIETMAQDLA